MPFITYFFWYKKENKQSLKTLKTLKYNNNNKIIIIIIIWRQVNPKPKHIQLTPTRPQPNHTGARPRKNFPQFTLLQTSGLSQFH
jgi:hypothetical protein